MKKIISFLIGINFCSIIFAQEVQYETKEKGIYVYDTVSHLLYNNENNIHSWNTNHGFNTNETVTFLYPFLRNSLSQNRIEELASLKAILIIGLSIDATGNIKEVFFVLNPIMEEYLKKNPNFINEINKFENSLINTQIEILTNLEEPYFYRVFAGIKFQLLYDWISDQPN